MKRLTNRVLPACIALLALMVSLVIPALAAVQGGDYDIRIFGQADSEITVTLTSRVDAASPAQFILAEYGQSGQMKACRTAQADGPKTDLTISCSEDSLIKAFVLNTETGAPLRDVWEYDLTSSVDGKILVAYFSCTNNTKRIAEYIAAASGADLYAITPETPYTSEDLNYGNRSSRATAEQNDPAARPALSGTVSNMEDYDVVFIGYPIWWGKAPMIIQSFMESYDFTGKTVIPFCTSGSSPIDNTVGNKLTNADVQPGQRFSGSASEASVSNWVDSLNLK